MLHIKKSYIPIVEIKEGPLKGKWADHQILTAEALKSKDIVFNTYPTGSGKTRALLNAIKFNNYKNILLIAPTNELLRQYREDVEKYLVKNNMNHEVILVTSSELDKINGQNHSKALEQILNKPNNKVLLTNPDIVHYVLTMHYGHESLRRSLFINLVAQSNLDLIAFDEFHYYDLKRSFFATLLVTLKAVFPACRWKLLFMSATPSQYIKEFAEQLDFDVEIVSPEITDSNVTMPFLSDTFLEVISGNIKDNLETIIEKLNEWKTKNFDAVVISDSLARISILSSKLQEQGWKYGEDYGMITGPATTEERKKALDLPLILTTPTVDIGYNFPKQNKKRQNIDCIIFEARNHADFIQRLHRAGRIFFKPEVNHPSIAVCLCPGNSQKTFEKYSGDINRQKLQAIAKEAFGEIKDPTEAYYQAIGSISLRLFQGKIKLLFDAKTANDENSPVYRFINIIKKMTGASNAWLKVPAEVFQIAPINDEIKYGQINDENREKLLQIIQKLRERKDVNNRPLYETDEDIYLAMKKISSFIDQLASFRSFSMPTLEVVAEKHIFGTNQKFEYDALTILSMYEAELKPNKRKKANPLCLGTAKVIKKLEKNQYLTLRILRAPDFDHGFFIPLKLKIDQATEASYALNKALSELAVPIYLLTSAQANIARTYGLHPRKIILDNIEKISLVGEEAVSAVGLFSGVANILPI